MFESTLERALDAQHATWDGQWRWTQRWTCGDHVLRLRVTEVDGEAYLDLLAFPGTVRTPSGPARRHTRRTPERLYEQLIGARPTRAERAEQLRAWPRDGDTQGLTRALALSHDVTRGPTGPRPSPVPGEVMLPSRLSLRAPAGHDSVLCAAAVLLAAPDLIGPEDLERWPWRLENVPHFTGPQLDLRVCDLPETVPFDLPLADLLELEDLTERHWARAEALIGRPWPRGTDPQAPDFDHVAARALCFALDFGGLKGVSGDQETVTFYRWDEA